MTEKFIKSLELKVHTTYSFTPGDYFSTFISALIKLLDLFIF